MKIVVYSIVIIIYLFLFSCKTCKEDRAFKKEFFNCIQVIEKTQKEAYFIKSDSHTENVDSRAFPIECLYAVTGYEGHVDKWTQPYYFYPYSDTIEYIDVDIKKWQEWYENNRCKFTKQMADSLIKKHAGIWDIPNLTWPISADSLVNNDKYIY
jgi:hypothetical protein